MRIAIIPARGGSKRIHRKNIRMMNGKPLIAWPIIACLEQDLFNHIIVSTDDEEIAAIAREHGAKTPFLRPTELADDYAGTRPVFDHALKWVCENWGSVKSSCLLYANPFVTAENIKKGYDALLTSDADMVLSVTEFSFPILRSFRMTERGGVEYAFPEYQQSRSQDLPPFYHDAAQFYWYRQNPPAILTHTLPIILPRRLAVDIDTEEDWIIAEQLHKIMLDEKNK